MKLPVRLNKSPLLDALFEVRFKPIRTGTGDLLPGVLYSRLQSEYSNIERLPLSQIPVEMRESDANLHYQPHYRLTSGTGVLQVGDRVVNYSHLFPYPGWDVFSDNVYKVLRVLNGIDFVRHVERISLRFINLIEAAEGQHLSTLNVKVEVADAPVTDTGLFLRFEVTDDIHTTIVQVSPKTSADIPSVGTRYGLLVDVDTMRNIGPEEFWEKRESKIEECHIALKKVFFSTVRSQIIDTWEPSWTQ